MIKKVSDLVNDVFDNFVNQDRTSVHGRIMELIDSKYSNLNAKDKKILDDAERDKIPVFVFTAKDALSIGMLKLYQQKCQAEGCRIEHIQEISERIAEFQNWQNYEFTRVKLPD